MYTMHLVYHKTKDNKMFGMGVMIGMLIGNDETVATLKKAIGKIISRLALENNELRLFFNDNTAIKLFDDGQTCCESRYMTTDDKLSDFVGSTLTGVRILQADNQAAEYESETHEMQFLAVDTNKGTFVCETHNEHNGYYGGFRIVCRQIEM